MITNEIVLEQGTGCHVTPITKEVSQEQLSRASAAFLRVRGIGCPTCAVRVRNGLLQIEGVLAADVVLNSALAKVWYDPSVVQPDALVSGLPAFANDGGHHYTAQLLEVFHNRFGDAHELPE